MSDPQQDTGLLAVLIERLESQRLPRAMELKNKVDRGESIDEFDLAFLQEVLSDAANVKPLIERHPEHQELVGKLFGLYREITEKAIANEKSD
ncbi:MAG TPA: hypothetical protein VER68_08765 [Azonexus sp.]|nr:hypothetical protein [Azonexus sp.]